MLSSLSYTWEGVLSNIIWVVYVGCILLEGYTSVRETVLESLQYAADYSVM